MSKTIAKVWTFQSDSNPNKNYETLQYTDTSTSCNCPGWTRRVAADGSRTCKHTRLVDQGIADSHAVSSHEYETTAKPAVTAKAATSAKPAKTTKQSKVQMIPQAARKIQWQ